MSGKARIIAICGAALVTAGCTAPRQPTATELGAPATVVPTTVPRKVKPATPPPSRPKASPAASRTDLPDLVGARSAWKDSGSTLLVTRTDPATAVPVPIFRQAIVLANVRAALAGSRAAPKAEFTRGSLTLTFSRGTPEEIAEAIKRAFSVPEVQRLTAALP